jgi:hypothetical protein
LNAPFDFLPEHIVGVTDTDNKFSVAINSVTQDKPVVGAQSLCQDAFIVGGTAFLRSGSESTGGLIYRLVFTATDEVSGDTCSGSSNVCVPAASETACVDTGNDFNATQCGPPRLGVSPQ